MRNKNGVQLSNVETRCADGKVCTCHYTMRLCGVCRDVGCNKREGRL